MVEQTTGEKDIGSTEKCIFCEIIRGATPAQVVFRGHSNLVILSIDPDRHPLIVSAHHGRDWSDYNLPDETKKETCLLESRLITAVREAYGVTSVAIFSANGPDAGQVVWHAHKHVIPCQEGKRTAIIRPQPLETFQEPENIINKLRSFLSG